MIQLGPAASGGVASAASCTCCLQHLSNICLASGCLGLRHVLDVTASEASGEGRNSKWVHSSDSSCISWILLQPVYDHSCGCKVSLQTHAPWTSCGGPKSCHNGTRANHIILTAESMHLLYGSNIKLQPGHHTFLRVMTPSVELIIQFACCSTATFTSSRV